MKTAIAALFAVTLALGFATAPAPTYAQAVKSADEKAEAAEKNAKRRAEREQKAAERKARKQAKQKKKEGGDAMQAK